MIDPEIVLAQTLSTPLVADQFGQLFVDTHTHTHTHTSIAHSSSHLSYISTRASPISPIYPYISHIPIYLVSMERRAVLSLYRDILFSAYRFPSIKRLKVCVCGRDQTECHWASGPLACMHTSPSVTDFTSLTIRLPLPMAYTCLVPLYLCISVHV
jgi:hypothetical protein